MDPIIFGLVVVLVINLAIFPIAYKLQTDKLTDITYALSFGTLAIYGFVGGLSITSVSKMILTALLLAWAIRLGFFLLNRVTKMGRDARFDKIRTNPMRFLRFFLIQAISSWIISLPFLYRLLDQPSVEAGFSDITATEWVGWAIALFGLIMESVADTQKNNYKSVKGNEGKIFYGGLYKIIQYPNYLGEILFWIGIFVASLSAISGLRWLTITSPIIIIMLLLFLSGIPTIEKARKAKHGDDPAYQKYINSTSKLIPGIF